MIVDACYAGAAAGDWFPQDGASAADQMEDQVISFLGPKGTALLCAASSADAALAPIAGQYTMFSQGLLHALNEGSPTAPSLLSFDNLRDLINEYIENTFKHDGVRPEIHVPDQRKGDISDIPFFPNTSFRLQQVLRRQNVFEKRLQDVLAKHERLEAMVSTLLEEEFPQIKTALDAWTQAAKYRPREGDLSYDLAGAARHEIGAKQSEFPEDMPVNTQITILRATRAIFYARTFLIASWLLFLIVMMDELTDISQLRRVHQLITVVAILVAGVLTILFLRAEHVMPIEIPVGTDAIWVRHPVFIKFLAKDYLLVARILLLETAPMYFSLLMLWMIIGITSRQYVTAAFARLF